MADKQGNLNGAYYGPAIPPPQQSNRRHSRSRGCCCCLFSVLWKILLVLVVLVVIAGFIFWLVVRPTNIKLHVTEATLTQFNLTSGKLDYNLALNVSMRNPNKKLGLYNDRIEARALFEGERFAWETRHNLGRLKKKSNLDLSYVFKGERLLAGLDADEIGDFNKQKTAGVFEIDLDFKLKNRLRLGDFIFGDFKPKIKCDLKLPLTANGVPSTTFKKTKCDFDFF